jgi:hypothetical protein
MTTRLVKMPWCTSDYRMDFCKEKAEELRASGEYTRVWINHRPPEIAPDGSKIPFGKIFVEWEEEISDG